MRGVGTVRVLVANEPRSYREALAGVLRAVCGPFLEVSEAEPEGLDAAVRGAAPPPRHLQPRHLGRARGGRGVGRALPRARVPLQRRLLRRGVGGGGHGAARHPISRGEDEGGIGRDEHVAVGGGAAPQHRRAGPGGDQPLSFAFRRPYSPECVEGPFPEVRFTILHRTAPNGALRPSPRGEKRTSRNYILWPCMVFRRAGCRACGARYPSSPPCG